MKKHYRTDDTCLNCGTTVPDKFCTSCGQENLELHENFVHLMFHSIGHYFHFESKFFNSMVPLLTKPGYLTKEYFAGKRASHLNPISMYISISILFFFLFTANSNSNKKDIIKEKTAVENTISEGETEKEKTADITNTSLTNVKAIAADTSAKKGNTISFINDSSLPQWLKTKAEIVMDDELSRQLFVNKLTSHLPKMMFILLPLFALILKLVNIRSRKLYAEHLVYSMHVHSFLFLFGSLLILLKWLLPFLSGWIMFAGFVVCVWYIYRSMRNTYRSTRWFTVYKFFMLAFAYTFLMLLSGFVVVVATLYTI